MLGVYKYASFFCGSLTIPTTYIPIQQPFILISLDRQLKESNRETVVTGRLVLSLHFDGTEVDLREGRPSGGQWNILDRLQGVFGERACINTVKAISYINGRLEDKSLANLIGIESCQWSLEADSSLTNLAGLGVCRSFFGLVGQIPSEYSLGG